ncbi:MAG: hypothetical protein ABH983_02875 [Candidatus Micrarchaeota archaeon]
MGGGSQQLEQGVEAAEETVRLATEHLSHIPQPIQPNITAAVEAALATIQATTAFGSTEVSAALDQLPYGIAHETMQVFTTEYEASAHSDRELRSAESEIMLDRQSDEQLQSRQQSFETHLRQDRREIARLARMPNPDRREIRRLDTSIRTNELELRRIDAELRRRSGEAVPEVSDEDVVEVGRATTTVMGWMTPEYLGEDLHMLLTSAPPLLTVDSERFFDVLDANSGKKNFSSAGLYFSGTNHISLRRVQDAIIGDGLEETVAHEILHYVAHLGGSHHPRWMTRTGLVEQVNSEWLHEGLTELHAQQLTRAHEIHPDDVTYEHETRTVFYIQRIVGEPVLRRAYLTGDFTEVRTRLNERLGEGTFETLLKQRAYTPDPANPGFTDYISNGAEALSFLLGRMETAGVDRSTWDENPIIYDSVRAERLIGGESVGSD